MTRFEKRDHPLLGLAVVLSLGGVFWADLLTPLGVVVWIFYLIPLALTLMLSRPRGPIQVATAATAALVTGYYFSSPSAELGAHIAALNRSFGAITLWGVSLVIRQFIISRIRLQEQDWLRTGQAGLVAQMQGELGLRELGDNTLRFICHTLDVLAGLLYASEGQHFTRVASFGVPADAPIPESVEPGDGLIGQAARERRLLRLDSVPEGYLTVGSGLGRARPRHLVLLPVESDGAVNGVIELGFMHPVGRSDLDFLELVAPTVSVAVRSAHYRARLQALLHQTQQQAEELQIQQEELRVTNEELEEQSRALGESQAQLESQQAELEQTNAHLEEQAQVLTKQREGLEQASAALAERAADLERVNQYKSEFLANMSHELRTPLNSSLILAKLLADNPAGNLTAEQVRFAETIYSAGNDLLALINDVLDLSRIEAGRLDFQVEEVSLAELLHTLDRTFEPVAQQKKLDYSSGLDPATPKAIQSDGQRLQQILKNLLSNAFKFTQQGSVSLRVFTAPGDQIGFAVRDSGIGIPSDKQQVIFEAFRQADGSTHRQYGGTGLGLSIARDLARRLGGDVQVESAPDQGSTFTLLLPRQSRSSEPPAPPPGTAGSRSRPTAPAEIARLPPLRPGAPPPPPRALRPPAFEDDRAQIVAGERSILIVEDDSRFARVVFDLAHQQGFKAVAVQSAEEGLELARRLQPSAVALDVNLPDESGLSLLEKLKRDGATRHIPVHVISVADHTQQALELGAVGYAVKPVKLEDLARAFSRLEERLRQKLRRVLVVEDSPLQRGNIGALLKADDVEVRSVGTAGEALRQLGAATFDCLVLDLALPDRSGFELLEQMASDEAFSFPPVIVYTARSLSGDEEQRLRRYSRSIVIKGARSPERLLDEVTLFLHRVESNLPREQQRLIREARHREKVFEQRAILLVEDDVRNVFALSSVLEPKGARLQIARNGKEALAALERSEKEEGGGTDLVLMDIMMPEMDGLTAMRQIRSQPRWQKLPIIALTAKAMPDDREKCLEAGANDYIAKPIDADKLLSLIRVWMPK